MSGGIAVGKRGGGTVGCEVLVFLVLKRGRLVLLREESQGGGGGCRA